MRRQCRYCLCRSCLSSCYCQNCIAAVRCCEKYSGFRQLSIFEVPPNPQYQSTPRHSWRHYGISKARYRQLTEYIQSGRYASLASQAAHRANKDITEYILISVKENKSYDALRVKWELGEIERIPYGKTDFYGIRRYFYSLFDKELRRIGNNGTMDCNS